MIFNTTLTAPGRAPDILDKDDVYGWLVGDWELDVHHYWGRDVSARHMKGEVHAAWVLEGRAVQDVWIMPRRTERTAKLDPLVSLAGRSAAAGWPPVDARRRIPG